MVRQIHKGRIEDFSTHIIKKDIDAVFAQLAHALIDRFRLVVDHGIVAKLIDQPPALGLTSRDTHNMTTHQLSNLAYSRSCCSSGTRNHYRITGLWRANIQQPKVRSKARKTINMQWIRHWYAVGYFGHRK